MKEVLVSYQSIYLVNMSSNCADRKNIKKYIVHFSTKSTFDN